MRRYHHPPSDQTSQPVGERKLILAVDDKQMITELYRHCLPEDRYRLIQVHDPTLLMDMLKFDLPDLIILDVVMPGENGISLYSFLKRSPITAHIPIIIISAFLSDDIHDTLDGRDYIIDKTAFDTTQFVQLIDSICSTGNHESAS